MKIFSYELFSIEKLPFTFLLMIALTACSCGSEGPILNYDDQAYRFTSERPIAASSTHACTIDAESKLWCWGRDYYGEATGSGEHRDEDDPQLSPFHVLPGETFKYVGVSQGTTYAIKTDGTLWSWGSDGFGARGSDDIPNNAPYAPMQVGTDNTWKMVRGSSGNYQACAIKEDSSLWCWGDNRYGMVGSGTMSSQISTPEQVGPDIQWLDVQLSIFSTCGVSTNQDLYCWGWNSAIESTLDDDGLNTGIVTSLPTRALEGLKIRSLSMGGGNGCALTTDGDLHCWGTNDVGQLLGTEKLSKQHGPRKVYSNNDWVKAAVPSSIMCGLKIDGSVECWGGNVAGSLGRGISGDDLRVSLDILPVVGNITFTDIFVGDGTIFAKDINENIYGWGVGLYGLMGQGEVIIDNPSPVLISLQQNFECSYIM